MKIATSTPDLLVLVDRPWLLGGLVSFMGAVALWSGLSGSGTDGIAERLLATGLGGGGLWAAWRFFPFVKVSLDRRAGTAIHAAQRITGTTLRTVPLDRIDRVAAQRFLGEGAPMERLAFVVGDDWIPLETGFSSTPRSPLADMCNDWLGRARTPGP